MDFQLSGGRLHGSFLPNRSLLNVTATPRSLLRRPLSLSLSLGFILGSLLGGPGDSAPWPLTSCASPCPTLHRDSCFCVPVSSIRLRSWGPWRSHFCIPKPEPCTRWTRQTGVNRFDCPSHDLLLLLRYVFPWGTETRTGNSFLGRQTIGSSKCSSFFFLIFLFFFHYQILD